MVCAVQGHDPVLSRTQRPRWRTPVLDRVAAIKRSGLEVSLHFPGGRVPGQQNVRELLVRPLRPVYLADDLHFLQRFT